MLNTHVTNSKVRLRSQPIIYITLGTLFMVATCNVETETGFGNYTYCDRFFAIEKVARNRNKI